MPFYAILYHFEIYNLEKPIFYKVSALKNDINWIKYLPRI